MKPDYSNISYENFKVRGPIVDGIFYPDDDLLLHNKVELLIENSKIMPGKAAGIISPHAAFAFPENFQQQLFNLQRKEI